jgi:hypothetical protein
MAYTTTGFNIRHRITLIVSFFYLHVCIDDGLFHFKLELRAFSVAIVLYIYTIKTKTIIGRIGVSMQMTGP